MYFYLSVLLVVFPSWLLPKMSGEIPGDPEELSRCLKREMNLRHDICKLLQGKQFSFFLFATWSVRLSYGYDSVMVTSLFESQKLVFVRPNSRSEDSLNGKVLLIFINCIVPVTESRLNHLEKIYGIWS